MSIAPTRMIERAKRRQPAAEREACVVEVARELAADAVPLRRDVPAGAAPGRHRGSSTRRRR